MTTALELLRGARVLMLNWRDQAHPRAGGSEVFCTRVAEGFAAAGAEVRLFTSRPEGTAAREVQGGITVLRRGSTLGVYPAAAAYLRRNAHRFDVVVDVQNGIPFFAPLFAPSAAVVCVVHHVHQDQFRLHYPRLVSAVGRVLEGPVSRVVYRRRAVVAVSPSTLHDVRRRLRLPGPAHVVPNGCDPVAVSPGGRSPSPRLVVVTRLVPHKRLPTLLEAVRVVRRSACPDLRVDLVGDGPDRAAVVGLVRDLGLVDAVEVHGRVSDDVKQRLVSAAWLTASASASEGWGLTLLEAAAAGVPAVAFRVPGSRDAVLDGRTGWLVDDTGEPAASLAAGLTAALAELSSAGAAERWADACRQWAALFRWERTTERLATVVQAARRQPPRERRATSSAAVVVVLDPGDERPRLRVTDECHEASDGTTRVLLTGCDERAARAVLARSGRSAAQVRPADDLDLLVGPHAAALRR